MRMKELEQLYAVFDQISDYINYEYKDGSSENFTNAVIKYILDQENQIDELKETIKDMEKQVERLENLLDDNSATIEDLKEQCKKYEEEINHLEDEIKE